MSGMTEEIRWRLFALQDKQYRDFQSKLMPTVAKETVIGVRIPKLRRLAKELVRRDEIEGFLNDLPHGYYEENNLHGLLIMQEQDYTRAIKRVEAFLPYIDNWATCDLLRPKIFQKYLPELIQKIPDWLASEHPYTIRFGIEMLMVYYLDESFSSEYPAWVARLCRRRENLSASSPRRIFFPLRDGQLVNYIPPDDWYYVNLMIAWYFATALAKQYDAVIPYIENYALDVQTHNKTIQKAIESYRVSDGHKTYLRTLRVRDALP